MRFFSIRYNTQIRTFILLTLGFGSSLMFHSCSEALQVLQQMNVQEPNVSVQNVKLTGLNLSKVDLLFNISVENPNNLGIQLSNLDYNLFLNNTSFLKGSQNQDIKIKANGAALVPIPLSLGFQQIRKAVSSLASLDTVPYRLDLKVGVNLPLLGIVQIPISRKGSFPNFKIPEISLQGINLKNLGFNGANLDIVLNVKNPNTFGFNAENLNYDLEINGLQWITGHLNRSVSIAQKSDQSVRIPVSLNFMTMGTAVYQLLTGNSELNYQLKGKTKINSSLEYFNSFNFPFNKSGKINLTK